MADQAQTARAEAEDPESESFFDLLSILNQNQKQFKVTCRHFFDHSEKKGSRCRSVIIRSIAMSGTLGV